MATEHIYLKDLHGEHRQWLIELGFYREEVSIYENRLEELVQKNTGQDVLAEVERFQNQFIRQKEVFDTIEHDIRGHEQELADYAEDHPIAIDHKYFDDHTGLRDQVESERRIFGDLKVEFSKFLAKSL